jgi:signal transduction histidine kinase
LTGCDEPKPVSCDPALTRQILVNLFGNALKYNAPSDGKIDIELVRESGGTVRVEVENACLPIGHAQRKRLFDRFSRLDSSRNRATEGAGLGLSLAQEFARVQGGELELVDGLPEDRIRFRLTLPAREP